jgi:regulation of enolase protein 1 (concanavalin A-like superfamily)
VEHESLTAPGVPMPLTWLRRPEAWSLADKQLTIRAGAQTDWFADPGGRVPIRTAPALVGRPPDRDFTLTARVHVDARATFDAGVLFIYADDETWAKLCLERSPEGEPTLVSVVTHGTSDDCNSEIVGANEAWLRLARIGDAIAFHASRDGSRWRLIRHFRLPVADFEIGFSSQSPTGTGCTATFAEIAYTDTRLADLRDGS